MPSGVADAKYGARYGWRPSLHDDRDHAADLAYDGALPPSVDLRPQMPAVYDQGQLGSCTANAVAACVEFLYRQQGKDFMPSRLWIYYYERSYEGTLGQGDTGAYGRDGFKVAHKLGVPPESDFPYDITRFQDPPPASAATDAPQRKIPNYRAVRRDVADLKAALAYGQPVAYGFTVYESFEQTGSDGVVAMPQKGEKVLGGHEVVMVGYEADHAIVRNSWSATWGDGGYCYVPLAFLTSKNCSDFRTIKPAA
jgi:C1A family cysteine protease